MPPKVKFTKDEIVAAGLRVARIKGAEGVTARDIAAELGVSTRPIFTYYRGMDELRSDLRLAARAVYRRYAEEGLRQPIPFLGFGQQYLRFAREEPQLYRMLFLSPSAQGGAMAEMTQSQALLRPSLCRIYHLDETAADRYFRNMWLIVHGLATLIVTDSCPYSDAELSAILTECSVSLCKACKEIPGFADGSFDWDAVFRELVEKS